MFVRLAEEACGTGGAVIDGLADLRVDDIDDRVDQRSGCVVLAAVASGVAHVLDLVFVQVRHLMLVVAGPEAKLIDEVDDFAQVVAALNLVLDLAEDLTDLVFDRVRVFGGFAEPCEVGEQVAVHEIDEVVASQRNVEVDLPVGALGCRPHLPAELRLDDEVVRLAFKLGRDLTVLLQVVEVLEEDDPRRLLDVVELAGTPSILMKDVVNVLEGVLKHALLSLSWFPVLISIGQPSDHTGLAASRSTPIGGRRSVTTTCTLRLRALNGR